MKGSIYIIRNLINGKGYVGKTSGEPEKRWQVHKKNAKRGVRSAIYAAIRAYGIDKFCFTVLLSCDESLLNEMEIYFIRVCNTFSPTGYGYNLTEGGDGGAKERPPLTAEHKRKISKGVKGLKHPPRSVQWLARQRSAKCGKIPSESQRKKQSLALKGRPKPPRTAEHKANMSVAKKGQNKGIPWSEARRKAYDQGNP